MDSTGAKTARHVTARATSARWTAVLAIVAAVALLIVIGATAADSSRARGELPRTAHRTAAPLRARAITPTTTTTTTTSVAQPVTAPPPSPPPPPPPPVEDTTLHTPEHVPDPWVRRPIQLIGRIRIPTIGLDTELRDQITQESIDLGPSHWPGTAAPGGFGNAVIAGHRSSHSAPFHDLANLHAGDPIIVADTTGRSFTYSVTEMFVVGPDALWIAQQTPGHTLTIVTCHPIGSAAERLVVRATLAE
jgi:LPXTG-site transpeptidase (sortase) family protein